MSRLTEARRDADRAYRRSQEVAQTRKLYWTQAKQSFVENGGLPWAFGAGVVAGLSGGGRSGSDRSDGQGAGGSGEGISVTRLILSGISLIRIGQSLGGPNELLD